MHELPVGRGLQDHLATWITYTTDEPSLLTAETEENLGLLQTEGRGPLTSNFAESGGFIRTRDDLEAPDIQLHAIPILFPEGGAGEILVDGWALSACLLRPTEHAGSSSCARACPTAKPRILHNYVVDRGGPRDAGRGRAAVHGDRRAAGAARGHAPPPTACPSGDDDASMIAHIERNSTTLYHPVATCAMGRSSTPSCASSGSRGCGWSTPR